MDFKYVCKTNLDSHRNVQWPQDFIEIPRVGDWIRGWDGVSQRALKVVSITHCVNKISNGLGSQEPYIEIELHNGRSY